MLFDEDIYLIKSDIPATAIQLSSDFLQNTIGSISIWVYIHSFNEGIRDLNGYRPLISHDTAKGLKVSLDGRDKSYLNVFSFRHTKNNEWQLWLSNDKGEYGLWKINDSDKITSGWHNFVIRWDHGQELFEILRNGEPFLKCNDYKYFWPCNYSKYVILGAWQDLNSASFINTCIFRLIISSNYLGDKFIKSELIKGKALLNLKIPNNK